MKSTFVALITSACLVFFGSVANAQAKPEHQCTIAVLEGSYGLLQTGYDVAGNARNGVGVVTFDGKGKWSLAVTEVKKDGEIQRITNPNGTYTVNVDCRGSAALEKTPFGTANWEFVIVDDGKEVLQIVTTPPRGAITWLLKKQFAR